MKKYLFAILAALALTACGGGGSPDMGNVSTSGTTSQTSQTLSFTTPGQTSSTNLLDSLAVLYPNGQLPANRSAQASQDLTQNPAALKLTAETAATVKIQSTTFNATGTVTAQAVAADYLPVQRVQNTTLYGAYFFSIYPTEITTALATNPNWRLEGPAFWASLATGTDLHPVHRFRNKTNGSYLYSIYETERAEIAANYAATFEYEGVAWYARQTPATGWSALYRFRNKTNGTYLFSAYESEKDAIVATYPDVFALEGIAYYVRQDAPVDGVAPPVITAKYTLTGRAQKGPLVSGSRIWVSELDSSLNPNGKIYLAQTKDDLGNFVISSTIGTNLVELVGTGYYMDEVTGSLSTSPVTLSAIADLSVYSTPTINILTTLQAPRLKDLIFQGKTYAQATAQSQVEVLAAFGVNSSKITSLNALNAMQIDGNRDQDSALLAASAILSKMSRTAATTNGSSQAAEMTYLLSRIASDIQNSGALTTTSIITARNAASTQLDLVAVRTNVETYYANRGLTITAPKFEEWVDKDGSGILPRRLVPTSGLTFTTLTNLEHSQIVTSNSVTISGLGAGVVAPLTVNSGTTIIKNSSVISGTSSTVQDGDVVAVRRTSPGFGQTTTASIVAGSTSTTWQITTKIPQIGYDSQAGASVPQGASNVYFAVPIKPSTSFTAHYVGVGVGSGGGLLGPPLPTSISIYNDNAGVPGSAIVTTNTFGSYFSAALTRLDGSPFSSYSSPQASLGTTGVALTASNVYWIVVQYSVASTPGFNNALGVNSTGLNRKMSANGSTWVNWFSSLSGNTDDGNPAALPGHFLAN